MRVLVMASGAGAGQAVAGHLEAHGDVVARCFPEGGPTLGCAAMAPGSMCPLDAGVDVAVVTGPCASGAGELAPGHAGARCALVRRIPLVVATHRDRSSALDAWATRVCDGGDLAAVHRGLGEAAAEPMGRESEAATAAVQDVAARRGLDPTGSGATVSRQGSGLRVHLRTAPGTDRPTAEVAAVRALDAVRPLAPSASQIDVSVR